MTQHSTIAARPIALASLAWTLAVLALAVWAEPPPGRGWRKLAQLNLSSNLWQSASPATTNFDDGSLEFTFPTLNSGLPKLTIVAQPTEPRLKLDEALTLAASFKLEALAGTEFLTGDGCGGLAFCRLFMEGKNERWFSQTAFPLAPETFTLTASLDPADWLDEGFNPANPQRFKQALKKLDKIGLSFGSSCGAAAGVLTREGGASFAILDYHLE